MITKIKIFVETSQSQLETKVNEWLAANTYIQLDQTLQSINLDGNDMPWITFTIVYHFFESDLKTGEE